MAKKTFPYLFLLCRRRYGVRMEGIRKTSRESCGFPCVFHYRSPHFPHFSHKLPVFHEIFICFSSNPNQIPKHPAWACAMMNPQSRKTPIKEEPVMSEQRPYPSQEKQSGQTRWFSFLYRTRVIRETSPLSTCLWPLRCSWRSARRGSRSPGWRWRWHWATAFMWSETRRAFPGTFSRWCMTRRSM